MTSQKLTVVNRDQLYKEVWETKASELAKSFCLTDSGFARLCKKLEVPKPGVEYWRRKDAGKPVVVTPLPELSSNGTSTVDLKSYEFLDYLHLGDHPPVDVPKKLLNPHPVLTQLLTRLKKHGEYEGFISTSEDARRNRSFATSYEHRNEAEPLTDTLLKHCETLGFAPQWSQPTGLLLKYRDQTLELSIEEAITEFTNSKYGQEEATRRGIVIRQATYFGREGYIPSKKFTISFGDCSDIKRRSFDGIQIEHPH